MTTITQDAPRLQTVPVSSSGRRIINVFRTHAVNRMAYLGIPWIIVGAALVLTLAIGLVVKAALGPEELAEGLNGTQYSWAVFAPFWYLVSISGMAVSRTFPFALGMGATRREFAVGTLLAFAGIASIMAGGITVLGWVEKATGGWWLGVHDFTSLWLGSTEWPVTFLSLFTLQMLAFGLITAIATIYMRWTTTGLLYVFVAFGLLLVSALSVLILTDGWAAFAQFFAGLGVTGLFASLLVLAAGFYLIGWLALRRATPKQ